MGSVAVTLFSVCSTLPVDATLSIVSVILVVIFFMASSSSNSLIVSDVATNNGISTPIPRHVF